MKQPTIRIRIGTHTYIISVPTRHKADPLRTQRLTSAIHALHVVRMLIVESGRTFRLEQTDSNRRALALLCERARAELEAAIGDI
jgi:hypothetical protein